MVGTFQNVGDAPQDNRTIIHRRYLNGEMTPMRNCRLLTKLLNDDSGQDLIEYALVAALIALSAIGAMTALTNKINNEFNKVGNSL
jgi:pilus assembly protein Flp/PilA